MQSNAEMLHSRVGLTQVQCLPSGTAASSFSSCLCSLGSRRMNPLTPKRCLLWFSETILKQLLEDDSTKYFRNGFRWGESHTVWCWNQIPVWDLTASADENSELRMGGCLQSFTHSSGSLVLSQNAIKGTSVFKETNCTTTLQKTTALRGCSCQTSLISFLRSPPGMVQPRPSWETMAAAFNAITTVFSHSPHLFSNLLPQCLRQGCLHSQQQWYLMV